MTTRAWHVENLVGERVDSCKSLWSSVSDQNAAFWTGFYFDLRAPEEVREEQIVGLRHLTRNKADKAAAYQSEISQGGCKHDIKCKADVNKAPCYESMMGLVYN